MLMGGCYEGGPFTEVTKIAKLVEEIVEILSHLFRSKTHLFLNVTHFNGMLLRFSKHVRSVQVPFE